MIINTIENTQGKASPWGQTAPIENNTGWERADVPPYGHQEDFCVMNWKSTAEGSELAGDTLP